MFCRCLRRGQTFLLGSGRCRGLPLPLRLGCRFYREPRLFITLPRHLRRAFFGDLPRLFRFLPRCFQTRQLRLALLLHPALLLRTGDLGHTLILRTPLRRLIDPVVPASPAAKHQDCRQTQGQRQSGFRRLL